jgi:hypothetical protein
MILFILGLIIGSVGGMIMMAMFLTGKTRESSFSEHYSKPGAGCPSDTANSSEIKKCKE